MSQGISLCEYVPCFATRISEDIAKNITGTKYHAASTQSGPNLEDPLGKKSQKQKTRRSCVPSITPIFRYGVPFASKRNSRTKKHVEGGGAEKTKRRLAQVREISAKKVLETCTPCACVFLVSRHQVVDRFIRHTLVWLVSSAENCNLDLGLRL